MSVLEVNNLDFVLRLFLICENIVLEGKKDQMYDNYIKKIGAEKENMLPFMLTKEKYSVAERLYHNLLEISTPNSPIWKKHFLHEYQTLKHEILQSFLQ